MKLSDLSWRGPARRFDASEAHRAQRHPARWRRRWQLAALAAVVWAASACAPPVYVASPDDEGPGGVREETTAARAVIAQLRQGSYAAEAALDLQRADSWIGAAEQRLADGDDGEVTRLLMLAAKTQLSAVKSFFAKREAEEALARVRGETDKDAE